MRITNGMKESIMRGVLRSKYKEDVILYFKKQNELMRKYLDECLKGLDIEELKKHGSFIDFEQMVEVFCSSYNKTLSYPSCLCDVYMGDFKESTTSFFHTEKLPCHKNCSYFVMQNSMTKEQYNKFCHEREVLGTEFYAKLQVMKETKQNLLSVLNSCTTVKQLLEVLPEVEKFVPSNSTAVAIVSGDVVDSLKKTLSDI